MEEVQVVAASMVVELSFVHMSWSREEHAAKSRRGPAKRSCARMEEITV